MGESSTAGTATLVTNPALAAGLTPRGTVWFPSASADNCTITNNGATQSHLRGGLTLIEGESTAGNATLIANGGLNGGLGGEIRINIRASGGTCTIKVFGNGFLDISAHEDPGVTVGSLEGDGKVSLGPNNLNVGSNHRSTVFSGVIEDQGGALNGHGSLTKIGSGTLTLSRPSTYTAGTTVKSGTLLVKNTSGSATGSGAVQVATGTLAGNGIISGPVSLGTGTGRRALLSLQNRNGIGVLSIQSELSFNADGIYDCKVDSDTAAADQVIANGVTMAGGTISISDHGSALLSPGTVLTIINNTAAPTINGTFANLPDGATLVIGQNTFQANYEGGDGNDLTLTVMP